MNIKEIVEALSNLKMTELIALTKELRDKWGITESVHPMMEPADKFVKQVEQVATVVDVVLVAPKADSKIPTIKLIRELTNVGLVEGKRLAETPNSVIIKGAEYGVAQTVVEKFKAIGAEVTLVPAE
jgi:large subunit ribosomal protein L7/L12